MSLPLAARLAPLRPDLVRGVRAAVATVVPLYFALSRHTHTVAWVALAGWLGSLADPGGTRGRRARVLFGFLFAGTVLVIVGEAAAPSTPIAAGVLVAAAFAASLLRALGADAGSLGTTLLVATAIATVNPRGAPLQDGAAFALGALWATALTSALWPIWTHLPVRRSVATVFGALSSYSSGIASAARTPAAPGDEIWTELARVHHRAIRTAVEDARRVALSERTRREGESRLGSNLRAVFGVGEASFFLLVALADEVEASADRTRRASHVAFLDSLAHVFDEIRRRLFARNLDSIGANGADSSDLDLDRESPLEQKLADGANAALVVARSPSSAFWPDGAAPQHGARVSLSPEAPVPELRLADVLSVESTFFRHGLRVACTVGVAFFLGRRISPAHVSWVVVTAIAVLQPYPGATAKRAGERVVGTVLGCLVTVLLMAFAHEPWELALVMFPLSVAAVVTRPRSYRWFTFFLTPVFVLFFDAGRGDAWTAAVRAGDALLGGLVALVAALLAFPSWEDRRLADTLDAAVSALSAYASLTFDVVETGRTAESEKSLARDRRSVGVALGEAETSLERLLSEPRRPERMASDVMQLITYFRRLAAAFTTLGIQSREYGDGKPMPAAFVEPLRAWVSEVFRRTTDALAGRFAEVLPPSPPSFRSLPSYASASLARIQRHADLVVVLLPQLAAEFHADARRA